MSDAVLILFSLITSMLTAITGVGGGMILIALMPGFLPAASIVPVHAMVQLFSNSSRTLFGWHHLRREFALAFIVGALAGGLLAAGFTRQINLEYTPLLIAGYILFSVWGPKMKFDLPARGELISIGFLQTALSMIVGATGPLGQTSLLRRGLHRDELVVTAAFMMSFTHLIKIFLFALLGFSFVDHWKIILGMSGAVILGAYIGTHIRYRISEAIYRKVLRWLLTLLALRMAYITLAG
ncbi:MAG: putative membrane protein YfcA [Planctomycetota bacterium]|jgi:uncharacterized membrane protein YfcA